MTISDYIKKEGERFEGEFWSKFSDKKYMSQQFTSSLKGLAKVIDEQSKKKKIDDAHEMPLEIHWERKGWNAALVNLSTLIASELKLV